MSFSAKESEVEAEAAEVAEVALPMALEMSRSPEYIAENPACAWAGGACGLRCGDVAVGCCLIRNAENSSHMWRMPFAHRIWPRDYLAMPLQGISSTTTRDEGKAFWIGVLWRLPAESIQPAAGRPRKQERQRL